MQFPWSPAGLKSRFYGLDDEQCTVEELALQYYASEEGGGWQGVHRQAVLGQGECNYAGTPQV